jgi:tRNA threonylcarbamoyl adenosine modification protein (Sua5/YciO/YrdC/YwlC family)
MASLISVNPHYPEPYLIGQAADEIRKGGIAVIPTDTVYAIVCSAERPRGAQSLYRLKGPAGTAAGKPLSVLFHDLSTVAEYTRGIPNIAYKVMKRVLPGPYTLILSASKRLPSAALQGRKTIGVRIPGNEVTLALLKALGEPLLSTSVYHYEGDDPMDDPIEISTRFGPDVDLVLDAGPILPEPSTVLDLSDGSVTVLREGKGPLEPITGR